jgi:hypothetical protein
MTFPIQVGDQEFQCSITMVLGKKTLVVETDNVQAALLAATTMRCYYMQLPVVENELWLVGDE